MKILRISLRNIASIEGTHTVDFTRDPLRSAGLFSISGITGSGKSTLLDALCLALYEKTPRLNAVRGAVKLADGADSVSQKDPANLLRRGTGEGFAEVAFIGVDNAAHTARWTVRRAHNRPDGSLQNTDMTLFRGDVSPGVNGEIEQGGKKSDVLPAIAAKVGLTFEQFTRAVLLAQNEFATFLKADDHERAEILQALTGTERFEKISITVYDRCAAESRAVADIEVRLAGTEPLPPEGRREAETAFASADAAWNDADAKFRDRETHAAWFKQLGELVQRATAAAASLRERIEARDAAAPRRVELELTEEASCDARPLRDAERRLRDELNTAEKSRATAEKAEAGARADCTAKKKKHDEALVAFDAAKGSLEKAKPELLQARDLDAKLTPITDRLAAATRDREAAEANAKQALTKRDTQRTKRDSAENERAPLILKREALAQFATFAPDAAGWLHRLDRAAECRAALEDAATKSRLRTRDEESKITTANAERAKEAALREAAAEAAAAFERADIAAKAHDGEKIARARSEADCTGKALRALEKHLQDLETVAVQGANIEAEIAKLKAENKTDGELLADLKERRIPEAEKTVEVTRRACDLAEAAVADDAIRLREKLVASQPCPVCGATDHPHSAQPPAIETAALRALRVDSAAKEKELCTLRDKAVALDAARSTRLAQEAQKATARTALDVQFAALCSVRHEHPAAATIIALPQGERAAALAAQLTAREKTLCEAEAADAARRDAEKLREERRAQRDRAAANVEALEKKLAKFDEELAGLRVAREAATATHSQAQSALDASLNSLTLLFAGLADARIAWDRDAAVFRRDFAKDTDSFVKLEKRLGELAVIIREADAALTPASEALAIAEQERMKKQADEDLARSAYDTVRTQRAEILKGRPANDVEAELNSEINRAAEMRDIQAGELNKADNHLTAVAEALKSRGNILAELTNRHTVASAALDVWIGGFANRIGRPFDRVELDRLLARDDAWIKAERVALDAMAGAIREAEGARAVHQKALDDHTAGRPTTDDEPAVAASLAALAAVRAEAGERRDAARAVLLADDQRSKNSADLARQLCERRARAEPWIKLNELIGSADGAKFRSIAQRRTLDILLGYANAQLELLAVRYRLERLPESLNLIVIDRDMGDERRSVHSLSGGESFLVSLALALALASLASNRVRIESLFIDEGFGSLDATTLNTAMNALMHLEAQGRKVGVISHVSEMTDAIPVQIRVVKGRSGASSLILPGPDGAVPNAPISDLTQIVGETQRTGLPEAVASEILVILRREKNAGRLRVSVRALREEISCSITEFNAARDSLVGQVDTEGRSLMLLE